MCSLFTYQPGIGVKVNKKFKLFVTNGNGITLSVSRFFACTTHELENNCELTGLVDWLNALRTQACVCISGMGDYMDATKPGNQCHRDIWFRVFFFDQEFLGWLSQIVVYREIDIISCFEMVSSLTCKTLPQTKTAKRIVRNAKGK